VNTALEFLAELYIGNTDNICCFSTEMNDELINEWNNFKTDSLSKRLKDIIKIKLQITL